MLTQQQRDFYNENGYLLLEGQFTVAEANVFRQEARTTLLVQMRDPENKPTFDTHASRGQGMMLRGYDPTVLPPEAQPRSI
jgi:hypothetical protein